MQFPDYDAPCAKKPSNPIPEEIALRTPRPRQVSTDLQRTFGEDRGTYYVIRTDMNGPQIDKKRHEHPSRVKAETEARRLAMAHPGVEFAVVKKKTAYRADLPPAPPPIAFKKWDRVKIVNVKGPINGKIGTIIVSDSEAGRHWVSVDGETITLASSALELVAYAPEIGDICFYRNTPSSLNDRVVVVTGWEGDRPIITGLNHLHNTVRKKARPEHLELVEVDRRNLFGITS